MDKDFGSICRYHHYLQPAFLRINIINLSYRYVATLCLFRNYKNFQNCRSWAHHLDS